MDSESKRKEYAKNVTFGELGPCSTEECNWYI